MIDNRVFGKCKYLPRSGYCTLESLCTCARETASYMIVPVTRLRPYEEQSFCEADERKVA